MTALVVTEGELSAAFRDRGYVRLHMDLVPEEAEHFCSEILCGSLRRVYVDRSPESWDEHHIADTGTLGSLMTSAGVLAIAQAALGREYPLTAKLWGNVYRAGEMIPWHTDTAGTIQLLLCLRPPPSGCGGIFLTRRNGLVGALDFSIGDAILFKATELEHSTTRLTPTAEHPDPSRIVAVSRFYEAHR